MKKRIMLVDDNITNLAVGKLALKDEYDVLTVSSGERALELFDKIMPDLILLDIDMPGIDGYETMRRMRENELISRIPVIFLTAMHGVESELVGLSLGAVDYITKPFNPPLLRKRIELHLLLEEQKSRLEDQNRQLSDYNGKLHTMVDEKTERITRLQDSILQTVADLVEFRDRTTGGHIDRTRRYLEALVNRMRETGVYADIIDLWDIKLLVQSSQLHDVGKIIIPDSILNKPGKLDDEEYEIVKQHTVLGKEVIDRIISKSDGSDFLYHASNMAYSHHERWDGGGYPLGLKGEEIPLQGRLMAVVDVFDALITERPYKNAFPHEISVGIIVEGRGTQFDPLLIDVFSEVSDDFDRILKGFNGW